MIDYAVDDLDALLARLHTKGVEILKRADDGANGRFAWILDPEGNKVELWEPKRHEQEKGGGKQRRHWPGIPAGPLAATERL